MWGLSEYFCTIDDRSCLRIQPLETMWQSFALGSFDGQITRTPSSLESNLNQVIKISDTFPTDIPNLNARSCCNNANRNLINVSEILSLMKVFLGVQVFRTESAV